MSTQATACPHCGYRKPMSMGANVAIKVIVAIGLFAAVMAGGKWLIDVVFTPK